MVKVTNLTDKLIRRRLPTGIVLQFRPNEPVEVKSERLLKQIQDQAWCEVGSSSSQVGGGLKTGVKPAKRRGRPPKAKTVQEKVDKKLAKPKKGLKKSKKGKAK